MDHPVTGGTGTTLQLRHRFIASPERVFAAWTTPAALRRWWCPAGWMPVEIAVDPRPGGQYRMAMAQESGARLVTVDGLFLEVVPNKRLVYTWRWEGAFDDMPETVVTVEFLAVTGGTELTLRQATLDLPICVRQLSGWLGACDRLSLVVNDPLPGACPDWSRGAPTRSANKTV